LGDRTARNCSLIFIIKFINSSTFFDANESTITLGLTAGFSIIFRVVFNMSDDLVYWKVC